MKHVHEYRKGKGSVDVCECGNFRHNEKAGPAITEITNEHLKFLDELRESGVTNMFGAGPYIQDEFGVSKKASHEILSYWMKTFSERKGE